MSAKDFGQADEIKSWSRKVQHIMDQMNNRSFCDFRSSGTWQPAVNVYESRGAYCICVDLAGLDIDAIVVECVDAQRVCISGQRQRPMFASFTEPFTIELMEIDEGVFHRQIDLQNAIETQSVDVCCEKGYLWIRLDKITTP